MVIIHLDLLLFKELTTNIHIVVRSYPVLIQVFLKMFGLFLPYYFLSLGHTTAVLYCNQYTHLLMQIYGNLNLIYLISIECHSLVWSVIAMLHDIE